MKRIQEKGRNGQQAEVEDDITEITSTETEKVIRKMKIGKATVDLTNYKYEVWTRLGRTGLHFLKPLTINKMIDAEKIPDI